MARAHAALAFAANASIVIAVVIIFAFVVIAIIIIVIVIVIVIVIDAAADSDCGSLRVAHRVSDFAVAAARPPLHRRLAAATLCVAISIIGISISIIIFVIVIVVVVISINRTIAYSHARDACHSRRHGRYFAARLGAPNGTRNRIYQCEYVHFCLFCHGVFIFCLHNSFG